MERKASLDQPLIVAAYLYGDPSRKRRVKVPPNIKWTEFLALFYSRLQLSPNLEIEIFDEKGIEIVSVDDLVEGDVLVVKEKWPKPSLAHTSKSMKNDTSMFAGSDSHSVVSVQTCMSHDLRRMSHDQELSSVLVRAPGLSHFIQCNSFGYYFLAEVQNMKVLPDQKVRKTHCVIKVPLRQRETGTLQTFEIEATLLRKISNHKCIVSAPMVQVLNFSDRHLQTFYKSLPQSKQELVQDLFLKAGCLEAYMYPLYGVTMATKIRTGLSPDKVLKYTYQLADVMHYLQQRGVIHLNLLPENIQVMSNDRLILCNFETAVRTDPTTCLVVASQTVVAPSNRKGLAPEVISALSQLRLETESVDYSTQYPWSFGVLSVLMATGHHPLKDYPEAFESAFRVKYRSHHFQALPDSEQYPPIFCKLIKKSLSCDPVRRPTLPQIFSIIRRDSKVMAAMSKGRAGPPSVETGKAGGSDVGVATRQNRGAFDPIQGNEQAGIVSNKPHPSPSRHGFHETHPPPSYGFTRTSSDGQRKDHMTRHNSHEQLQINSPAYNRPYESPDQSHDPYIFSAIESAAPRPGTKASNQITDSLEGARNYSNPTVPKRTWDTFSEERSTSTARSELTPINAHGRLALRREGSDAFSDNFVSPQLSRQSSGHSVRQGAVSAGQGRGMGNSESDLSEAQEFPYQRLVPSPQTVGHSSDDHSSPTLRRTSDQERLVRGSSPEHEETMRSRRLVERRGSGSAMASKKRSPESSGPRVLRSSSYRMATMEGQVSLVSPLNIRRCYSDGVTKEEKMDTAIPDGPQGATAIDPILLSNPSHDHHMTSQEFEPQSHDVHMNTQSEGSPSSGAEGILMSSSTMGQTTTNTQTTNTSFNLTSPASQTTSLRESPENMDIQSAGAISENLSNDRGLLSPVFLNSNREPLAGNKEFWASVMGRSEAGGAGEGNTSSQPGHYLFSLDVTNRSVDETGNPPTSMGNSLSGEPMVILSPASTNNDQPLFPQALSENDLLRNITIPSTSQSSTAPLIPRIDEDLTPKDNDDVMGEIPLPDLGAPVVLPNHSTPSVNSSASGTLGISNWIQSVSFSSASQAATVTTTQSEQSFESAPRNYNYIMSPIPEASQELTSSMSQPNSHLNRLSGSQFRSVSPISEHTSSSDAQRSLSPRPPHLTRTESDQPSSQQSGTSEQGSTGQGSSVLTALNLGTSESFQTQQTGSETGQTGLEDREARGTGTNCGDAEDTTDRVETDTPTVVVEVGQSQSGADHVTSSYESMTSSARAEVGGANEAHSSTPTPSRSTDATPTLGGEPLSSSSPQGNSTSNLHSSNESIERSRSVFRGKSPQSVSSAPASFPSSVPRPSRTSESTGQRPLSPLATTVHRSTEMLDTVGRTESRQEVAREGSVNEARASGMEPRPDSVSDSPLRPRRGSGNRFRYSQQRPADYPRSHQKISQDLEMMNLAISGMDNTNSSVLSRSLRSEPLLPIERRSPTGHAQRPSSNLPLRTSRNTAHAQRQQPSNEQRTGNTQRPTRGLQRVNQPPSNEQSSGHAQRQARTRNDLDVSRTFRPITPALQGNTRSASAPNSSGQDSPSTPVLSTRQPPGPTGLPPPQVPADSYDYLPPYSPPRPQDNTTPVPQQNASEPGLLAEPPPSYDEIFGGRERDGNRRRRRNGRSRFSRRSHSYRETLDDPVAVLDTPESSQTSSRPSSRQSNSRRLISFTNFFKRARRSSNAESVTDSPTATQTGETATPATEPRDLTEFTADWVASYSRTPRPHAMSRQENLASRSTGSAPASHSQLSRTVSDTISVRSLSTPQSRSQNPVPYRHPPPFPSTEDIVQPSPNSVSRSYPPPNHGGSSRSLNVLSPTSTRLPVRARNNSSGSRTGHMIPQVRSHVRPRPSSAYIPTEVDTGRAQSGTGSASSTPATRTRHLVGAGGISNSCFDILSPQSTPSHSSTPHTSTPHTSTPHTTQPSTAHHTTTTSVTNSSQSRIRAPRITRDNRVQSSNRGRGSTSSLNQASNLSINANTNNVNARASPRASLTSSPISMTSPNRVDSPIAFSVAITPSRSSQHSMSNLIISNSQEFGDATLTPPSASQITVVSVVASGNSVGGGSDVREDGAGVGSVVDVREGSGRSAMRMRAESRRMREHGEASSEEEQHSQMSNLSQSSQRSKVKRRRRQRSLGSNGTIEIPRSISQLNTEDRSNNTSRASLSRDQSHDQEVSSPGRSPGQRSASRDNIGPRMSRVTEERETQSIEVTIETVVNDTSTISLRSKSCGHPCDSGDQVMCCLCTVEQRAAAFPGSQGDGLDVINSCQLCQRRESNLEQSQRSGLNGNKHTARVQTNESVTPRNRTGRSCSVM